MNYTIATITNPQSGRKVELVNNGNKRYVIYDCGNGEYAISKDMDKVEALELFYTIGEYVVESMYSDEYILALLQR